MKRLNSQLIRSALHDGEVRVPNTQWDLTGTLTPIYPEDPFAILFDLHTFEARWIGGAPTKPFSDAEAQINQQYCEEVNAIWKLLFKDKPSLNEEKSDSTDTATFEHLQQMAHREWFARTEWERHVSPVIVKNDRVYIIRQSEGLMQPANIRTMAFQEFANKVVVHNAAANHKRLSLENGIRYRDNIIATLCLLLIIAIFAILILS
jgi:hypothetical protein